MFPQEANIVDGSEDGFFISGYLQSRLHEELGQKEGAENPEWFKSNTSVSAGAKSCDPFTQPVSSSSWAHS